jgi:hypothetical protein
MSQPWLVHITPVLVEQAVVELAAAVVDATVQQELILAQQAVPLDQVVALAVVVAAADSVDFLMELLV